MYSILKNKIVLGHKKARKSIKLPSADDKTNYSSSNSRIAVAVVVVVVVVVVVMVVVVVE